MPTPAAIAVYQAGPDTQATAAITILVALLRTLAQKGSLSPDDVDAVMDRAESIHHGSDTIRRRDAARLIGQMRLLLE